MLLAQAQFSSGLASPRRQVPCRPQAVPRVVAGQATTSVQTLRQESNILPAPPSEARTLGRREELALQAKQLLEQDSKWHEQGELPSNMVAATSPKHFKQLITASAAEGKLAVVDYMAPHCNGCRTLFPKLKQIAGNNVDCVFIKVNTDSPELRELAMNLGVTKLPFFQLWRDCDIVASFTANVTTVSALRAEISAHKVCTDPGCAL